MKDENVTMTNVSGANVADADTTIREIERLERELGAMNAKAAERAAVEDKQAARLKSRSYRTSVIATLLFTLLIFVLFSAQTYAYFTDSAQSFNNSIQSGNLDVSIIPAGQSGDVTSYSFAPGTVIEKEVKIDNAGSLPMYVRARIDITIDKAGLTDDEKAALVARILSEQLVKFNIEATEGADWILSGGYYYYKAALAADAEPVLLYSTVIFSPNMGNEYTNAKITITVNTEAVQSDYNGTEGVDPWDSSVLWTEN